VPNEISSKQAALLYANEADVLKYGSFWQNSSRMAQPKPQQRRQFKRLCFHSTELLVLANIESMNAEFIKMEIPQSQRLIKLNLIAISQLKSLVGSKDLKKLE
jgi:hypothetical protein